MKQPIATMKTNYPELAGWRACQMAMEIRDGKMNDDLTRMKRHIELIEKSEDCEEALFWNLHLKQPYHLDAP